MWCDIARVLNTHLFATHCRMHSRQHSPNMPNIPNIKTHLNWQLPFFPARIIALSPSRTPPPRPHKFIEKCVCMWLCVCAGTNINSFSRQLSSIRAPGTSRLFFIWLHRHTEGHTAMRNANAITKHRQPAITATDIVLLRHRRQPCIVGARSLTRSLASCTICSN